MEAAAEGRTDTVNLLIGKNADRFLLDMLGRSALLIAKQQGHMDIVEMLK